MRVRSPAGWRLAAGLAAAMLLAGPGPIRAAAPGTWIRAASMPTERAEVGAAAVDDTIYVLGGGPWPGDSRSNVVDVFRLS